MVQFHFTNKDLESLKGLYRIMGNGFVSPRLGGTRAPVGLLEPGGARGHLLLLLLVGR